MLNLSCIWLGQALSFKLVPLSFWHVLSFFDHFPCSHLVQDVSVSSCFHVPALKSVISSRSPRSFYRRMYLETRSECICGITFSKPSQWTKLRYICIYIQTYIFTLKPASISLSLAVHKILWVHTDSSLTPQSSFYFSLFHICDFFLWQRNLAPIILNIFT